VRNRCRGQSILVYAAKAYLFIVTAMPDKPVGSSLTRSKTFQWIGTDLKRKSNLWRHAKLGGSTSHHGHSSKLLIRLCNSAFSVCHMEQALEGKRKFLRQTPYQGGCSTTELRQRDAEARRTEQSTKVRRCLPWRAWPRQSLAAPRFGRAK
jgi:hypothetical protein